MEKLALAEAEKADAAVTQTSRGGSREEVLLEKFTKPSGVSEEERMKRAAAIIERAVANGLTEVLVGKFPNALFTDHGRAINQQEPGWEKTLTGVPKELYEFWERQLAPARLQTPVSDRRLSGRDARRHRHDPEMGLSD